GAQYLRRDCWPEAVCDLVAHHSGSRFVAHVRGLDDQLRALNFVEVRLLVFDNCEHLRDATADLIEAILAHSVTVTILATSREGLGLAHERRWPVPSRAFGAGTDSALFPLFVEHPHCVAPGFSVPQAD